MPVPVVTTANLTDQKLEYELPWFELTLIAMYLAVTVESNMNRSYFAVPLSSRALMNALARVQTNTLSFLAHGSAATVVSSSKCRIPLDPEFPCFHISTPCTRQQNWQMFTFTHQHNWHMFTLTCTTTI